ADGMADMLWGDPVMALLVLILDDHRGAVADDDEAVTPGLVVQLAERELGTSLDLAAAAVLYAFDARDLSL
ncbi:MAG: hypothetical protein K9L65_17315, partial [Chromatiaceae bacterium]|nr:hypothetical protein [Chromatiaceae bacterium]